MSEPTWNPRPNRKKTFEILLEKFSAPAAALWNSPTLCTFAVGAITAIIVDIGETASATPIYEGCHIRLSISQPFLTGHAVIPAVERNPKLGASSITDHAMRILTERGYSFTTMAEREIVKDIVRCLCYVALDFDEEMGRAASASCLSKSYELPDGQVITIENEKFRHTPPFSDLSHGFAYYPWQGARDPIHTIAEWAQWIWAADTCV